MKKYIYQAQKGAVLIISLIFLMVLTLLGITAMDTTILETKLVAYAQERSWAFQMAEAGLKQANTTLDTTLSNANAANAFKNDLLVDTNLNLTDIARANAVKARTDNTKIEYKGAFSVSRSPAGVANSVTKIQMLYYESSTTGHSTEDAASVSISLRNGLRQAAPK